MLSFRNITLYRFLPLEDALRAVFVNIRFSRRLKKNIIKRPSSPKIAPPKNDFQFIKIDDLFQLKSDLLRKLFGRISN